ncbi:MAG: YcxB family protein [Clostridium sp.]|nr:YcxB family protein [Clostridium sp.]
MNEQNALFSCQLTLGSKDHAVFIRKKMKGFLIGFALLMPIILLGALAGVAVGEDGEMELSILLSVLAAVIAYCLLIFALIYWLTPKTQFRLAERVFCTKQSLCFYDGFVTANGETLGYAQSQTIDYSLFDRVEETKTHFLFFINWGSMTRGTQYVWVDGLILPKQQLTADRLDWLRGFLAHKLGDKFKSKSPIK